MASDPVLRVLAIEPYYGLSHKVFLDGYSKYSRHEIEVWKLPARKWKWRMRGAAIHFADRARNTAPACCPDVVLASDFLNFSDWRSLAPMPFREAPAILYFHENQITYPLSSEAPRDFHYGWINLSSALGAERVLFNSNFHKEEFLREVERVLELMPDHVPLGIAERIRKVSDVFPVGIDFEQHRGILETRTRLPGNPPVIVWNHRWEYDKSPERAVETLLELKRRGVPFRAILCGQSFKKVPPSFERAVESLKEEIIHMGFYPTPGEYLAALGVGDVVFSTSRQEFFGVSVVEAMFMGCLPVLPRALSYPEIIPQALHPFFLYEDSASLPDFLASFLAHPPLEHRKRLQEAAAQFDWQTLARRLDDIVEDTLEQGRR